MTLFKKKMKAVCMVLAFFLVFSLSGMNIPLPGEDIGAASRAEASGTRTLGSLNIGDRVVDNSWEWQFRTDEDYSYEAGNVTKPVTWIVVAKDHYGAGTGVTLLSEELIGLYTFDNSTDRGDSWWGSNHWGNSGTTDATKGLRPWLNSTGIHAGEGFYHAFSENFKNGIITITVPNKEWETGNPYTTQDNVFLPSATELGETFDDYTYEIGTAFPYLAGSVSADRTAQLEGNNILYWTRSPFRFTNSNVIFVNVDGRFSNHSARSTSPLRPALNLSSEVLVSGSPNTQGAYELAASTDPAPDPDPTISVSLDVERKNASTLELTAVSTGGTNVEYRFDIRVMDSGTGYNTIRDYAAAPTFTWNGASDGETYEIVVHADSQDAEYSAYYVVFGNTDSSQIVPFTGLNVEITSVGDEVHVQAIPEGGSNVIYALVYRAAGGEFTTLDPSNPYQTSTEFVRALPFGNYEVVVHAIEMADGRMTYIGEWQAYSHN